MRPLLLYAFLTLIICAVNGRTVLAQNAFKQKIIQGGAAWGVPFWADHTSIKAESSQLSGRLGGLLSIDAALGRRFSVGGTISYQPFAVRYTQHEYEDASGVLVKEDTDLDIRAIAIYLRALIHPLKIHQNNKEKIDLYFGGGTAYFSYNYQTNSNSTSLLALSDRGPMALFGIGGLRYYPIEPLGVFFEASFPSNHFFTAGFTYRLDWQLLDF